jgi:hypothetical protein
MRLIYKAMSYWPFKEDLLPILYNLGPSFEFGPNTDFRPENIN